MRSGFAQIGAPRAGKGVIGLLIANTVLYVLELVLMRADVPVGTYFFLTPERVFSGWVWQVATSAMLHSPLSVGHLLFNMLALWIFGAPLEKRWGTRRLLGAYAICALSGSALTLIVALLSMTPLLSWLVPGFASTPHVGASGATMGLTIAWAVLHAKDRLNFFLMGEMTGRTFALITVGIQILVALSYDNVSSSSHFGGMIGGFVLVKDLWRPSTWSALGRRSALEKKKKKLEHELRVIEGGRGKDDLPN